MLTADFPLKELETYTGINPCPADFDDFWQKSLKEMRSVEPDVKFLPAEFHSPFAECFNMSFTGVRGARINAKFIKPKNIKGKIPAILQFHGYNCSNGDWNDKLNYVAAGFAVAAMSCRGQSGMSEDIGGVQGLTSSGQLIRGIDDKPENMTMRHIMLDTAEIANIVMNLDFIDEKNVYAMGASQGGGLTCACASLEPRIRKAAPTYPFLSDYKRVWDMDLAKDAYGEIRHYFRTMDPSHSHESEVYEKLGYIDIKNMAKWIKADVLMATGLSDNICPPSTQFAVYNRITSNKKHILYPDFGHEWIPEFGDLIWDFFVNGKI